MLSENNNFELEAIVPTQFQTIELFDQLISRKHNISHHKAPKFSTHEDFVKNHPYRAWFLIRHGLAIVGNLYLQFDNSIGLNLKTEASSLQIKALLDLVTDMFLPLPGIPSVRSNNFFINVPSSDTLMQKKLKLIGLDEQQRSFSINNLQQEQSKYD